MDTDQRYLQADAGENRDDGCTAVTAVLVGQKLVVAHVGDSRAVLLRAGQGAQALRLRCLCLGEGLPWRCAWQGARAARRRQARRAALAPLSVMHRHRLQGHALRAGAGTQKVATSGSCTEAAGVQRTVWVARCPEQVCARVQRWRCRRTTSPTARTSAAA